MAPAGGDAAGWDDSGTDFPCPFLCSGDGDFWKELSGLTGGPLHSLVDRLQRVIMLDKAPSTAKAYIAAFKRWHRWASELKLPTLPAKAPHVALFLLHLAQETASCAATTQSVAALRWMHEKASVADPTSHPTVKQLCQALRRLHSRPIHRKPPLSPLQFKEVISCLACDGAPLADLQTATIFVLGFCGFLRWDDMKTLKRNSLDFCDTHMTIHFGKRKNYQLRDCEDLLIARAPEKGHLCPVNVIQRFLTAGKHAPSDPLLRKVTASKNHHHDYLRGVMSYSRSLELVKQALERAGIDSTEYGTHSLRSGGTTAAARAHVAERLIQRHGGWKSASSKNCYISDSLEDALSVSRAVLH